MRPARLALLAVTALCAAALAASGCLATPPPQPAPGAPPGQPGPPAPGPTQVAATATAAGPARAAGLPIPPGWCKDGRAFSTEKKVYCLRIEPLTWAEAAARCAADKGKLALPQSAVEARAIVDGLRPQGVTSGDFWVGLSRVDGDEWRWVTGEPLRDHFSAWHPGEPNNAGDNERCGEVYWGTGLWNDLVCEAQLPFLCRVPASKPSGAVGGFQPLRCPGALLEVGGQNYCWHNTRETWSGARNACASLGGDLATISTQQEHAALVGSARAPLRGGRLWLGATDKAREGLWVSTSGERISFDDWHPSEPNNAGGNEHCLELLTDHWNDMPCEARQDSLCEAL